MRSNTPPALPQVRAITMTGTRPATPRNGVFPKAPGPGLIAFALFVGVLPSAFATIMILGRGIEAGFYMPADFVLAQSRWLAMVAGFVTVPALIALFYVIKALGSGARDRGALIAVACILGATVAGDWILSAGLRSLLVPVLSEQQVQQIAERGNTQPNAGQFTYRTEGGVFHVEINVSEHVDDALLNASFMSNLPFGQAICVPWGHLFTGPISVVNLAALRPDGSGIAFPVAQSECREWYLQRRTIERRPRNLGAGLDR